METLLKERMSTIIALILGTGCGWSFTEIITAPELKTWMITISVAVSFLLSLAISLSLVGRMSTEKRDKMKRRGWFLIGGFVAFIALFFILYSKHTVTIPRVTSTGQIGDTVIVKGLTYTPVAKKYRDSLKKIDQFKSYPADEKLLEDATYDIKTVWSNNSRIYAKLLLLLLYTIMICLFIGGATLITETFMRSKRRSVE